MTRIVLETQGGRDPLLAVELPYTDGLRHTVASHGC